MPPVKLEDCFPVGCGLPYEVIQSYTTVQHECGVVGLCPDCARRLRKLSSLNLRQLVDLQVQYHNEHAVAEGEEWLEHAFQHLVILTAKMARYFRQDLHGTKPSREELEGEVVPDLLFWFLETMIGLQMTDPAKVFATRITANIKRDEERARASRAAQIPPMCMSCGIQMVRAGSAFACPGCGNSSERNLLSEDPGF